MEGAFAYSVTIVFFVIALNLFFLYRRLKRDKSRRPKRKALDEQRAAVLRDNEIKRRLEREQDDAMRRVELRNRYFELLEQVRHNAAEAEREDAEKGRR